MTPNQPPAQVPMVPLPDPGLLLTGEQMSYIVPPSVDIEMTLAATKSGDIGFNIKVTGEPTEEQIDKAVESAERACQAMIMVRRRMMALREEPAPTEK